MSTTTSTLQIIAQFKDQASSELGKTAAAAGNADKALASLTQKLQFQARAADLAAKSLQSTQAAYERNGQKSAALQDRLSALNAQMAASGVATAKEAKEAATLTAALERLRNASDTTAQAIGRKQLALDKAVASMAKTRDQANGLGQAFTNQSQQAEQSGSAFSGLAGKLALAGGAFFALGAVASKAIDWARQGAAIEGVRDSFEKLAVTAGTTGDTLLAAMQKASKGTISNSDLMAKANAANILTQGRLTSELPRLLEIAGASAKAMGTNVNDAFDSIVLGLSRNSKMIIDNLGITVDLSQANQAYADSIGVSVGALTDQQKSIAFTNAVLAQGDVLVQTLGTSTLTSAEQIAQADATLKNFGDSLKILAGDALGAFINGVAMFPVVVGGFAAGVDALNTKAIENQITFAQYKTAFEDAGQGALALTEKEFAAASAMAASGVSAEAAATSVTTLSESQVYLESTLARIAVAAGISEAAQSTLIDRAMELASASPEAAAAVEGLIEQFGLTENIEAFTAGLDDQTLALEANANNHEFAASTSFGYADAQIAAADATLVAADAVYALNEEQTAGIQTSAEAELATALLAERQAQMEQVVRNVESGLYSEAQAAALLASQFNITNAQAAQFLNTQLQLNAALGRARAIANFGNVLNAGGRAAETTIREIARPARSSGGGRSGGGGGGSRGGGGGGGGSARTPGKSAEVKQAEKDEKELAAIHAKADKATQDYQKKRQDLEKSHVDKLAAINESARKKELDAVLAFNEDKFQGEVGFKEAIVGVDQDLWDAALATEDAYWAKSQEMAQAGDAQKAADYLAAGTAYAQLVAENAQEIRDLQASIAEEEDAAARARLEQRLAREKDINAQQEQLAKDKVTAIEEGGNKIEEERQSQLAAENADYSDAQTALKQALDETFTDISKSYSDLSAAMRATADAIVAAAQAASAAVGAIPGVAGTGETPAARALGGPVRRNTPYIVGERAPELFVPRQNGEIMNQQQLRSALTSGVPSLSRAAANTTTSSTFAPSIAIDMRGASPPVQAAKAEIMREIDARMKQWNSDIGKKAVRGGRS